MAEHTRSELQSLAENTNVIDNTVEGNTPLDVRNQYEDERDSSINKLDDKLYPKLEGGKNMLTYSNPPTLIELGINDLATRGNVASMLNDSSINSIVTNPDTPYSIIDKDSVYWDCATGNKTINLPSSPDSIGATVTIVKTDSTPNTITVLADGLDTINGGSTQVINTQYDSFKLQSNGSSWFAI